ncbi:MAG: hypothetical protein R2681_06970 [Pyrinomonadaceae bacterium]
MMSSFFSQKKFLCAFAALIFIPVLAVRNTSAQSGDYLTSEEIELIRLHQEIDMRMKVYVKAVERRFIGLTGVQSLPEKEQKQIEKDSEMWGEIPKGSQTKMLSDIDRIIGESIDKIDDVASRDQKSELFPDAVHILADAARTFIPRLSGIGEKTRDPREIALISSAIGQCNDIIEASTKIEKPSKKSKKDKKPRI